MSFDKPCRSCTVLTVIAPLLLFLVILLPADCALAGTEHVTFYPTYGYKKENNWIIPMRVWVHENRSFSESLITRVAASLGNLDRTEIDNFRLRIAEFIADDESGENVILKFDNDLENKEYRVQGKESKFSRSDKNGLVEGFIVIPATKAQELLKRHGAQNGWLTYRAVSKKHSGIGRVKLLEPSGFSVISDIDDTIKITDIPAGQRVVVRNTFFRDYVAVPRMAGAYRSFSDASFHYVSGSPWQLYRPLSEFLFGKKGDFPEGTFHLKNLRKNLLSLDTWKDLQEFTAGEMAGEQKLSQISEIMQKFPDRKFILIGDSGEKDPEVYRKIRTAFPKQVQEIRIRDVVNDREKNPARLSGMTIIPAGGIQLETK